MTVEELNIKITADAQNFKKVIADANKTMESFRQQAEKAGETVTDAFSGLIEVGVTGESSEPASSPAIVLNDTSGRISEENALAEAVKYPDVPTTEGFINYFNNSRDTASRTAQVPQPDVRETWSRTASFPQLDSGETVIGAVSGDSTEVQPVNITTTVELDGDRVGEAVSRYFVRRDRITNGIED